VQFLLNIAAVGYSCQSPRLPATKALPLGPIHPHSALARNVVALLAAVIMALLAIGKAAGALAGALAGAGFRLICSLYYARYPPRYIFKYQHQWLKDSDCR
jgi:hypothetical protein